MANVNCTEAEFGAVLGAAMDAKASGDMETARTLDKLARKINASLSNSRLRAVSPFGTQTTALGWKDVPSTIGEE